MSLNVLMWRRSGRLPECRSSAIVGSVANRCWLKAQAAWNRSSRCAGARWGTRGQTQMSEDSHPHRWILDGGDDLQGAAASSGQGSISISKTRLSKRAQLINTCSTLPHPHPDPPLKGNPIPTPTLPLKGRNAVQPPSRRRHMKPTGLHPVALHFSPAFRSPVITRSRSA